ncbi:hypothetical protein CEUSTIGMA_g10271.t1 [Chlamydomonas eustigma]|uniref:Ribosomal protein L5 C-terminal domain-containing protein n=1 Tax=Chlamydomonas eustigma TaxID=1157962 RepID=A0A250XIC9_9CHLO|nr:hypothetical protein CEUSTIGMA_g10271.t1 [Chlamydomonas eustigma]|eukprot:GAX82845.1 hypothetical protein CEUSTIGMA_g10271.t1 [Chlamydomonas eustigma]
MSMIRRTFSTIFPKTGSRTEECLGQIFTQMHCAFYQRGSGNDREFSSEAPPQPSSSTSSHQSSLATTMSAPHEQDSIHAMSVFNPSRYTLAYHKIFYRELMLRMSPRHWYEVPHLSSITLTINAAQDTRLDRAQVPKSELLLYMLALEMIACQPANFIELSTHKGTGKAEGVISVLRGEHMLNFLEKLVYMVLPSQVGFEGSTQFQEVAQEVLPTRNQSKQRSRKASSDRNLPKRFFSDLKVTNLMLYPDFEQNFDLFEPLRSMQVRFEVEGGSRPEDAACLLSAFSLPIKY